MRLFVCLKSFDRTLDEKDLHRKSKTNVFGVGHFLFSVKIAVLYVFMLASNLVWALDYSSLAT